MRSVYRLKATRLFATLHRYFSSGSPTVGFWSSFALCLTAKRVFQATPVSLGFIDNDISSVFYIHTYVCMSYVMLLFDFVSILFTSFSQMRRKAINCKASTRYDDRFREEILHAQKLLKYYLPVELTPEIEKLLTTDKQFNWWRKLYCQRYTLLKNIYIYIHILYMFILKAHLNIIYVL